MMPSGLLPWCCLDKLALQFALDPGVGQVSGSFCLHWSLARSRLEGLCKVFLLGWVWGTED